MFRTIFLSKIDSVEAIGASFMCMGFSAIIAALSLQLRLPFAFTNFFVICILVSIGTMIVSALTAASMGVLRWLCPAEEPYDEASDPFEQVADRYHHLGDRGPLP